MNGARKLFTTNSHYYHLGGVMFAFVIVARLGAVDSWALVSSRVVTPGWHAKEIEGLLEHVCLQSLGGVPLSSAYLDSSGMSLTIEQVVTRLKQEIITLKAQVANQTGLADAVRAINNLATAQVRKDTPSLMDVNDLGTK